jgi:hypothetical protein
MAVLLAASASAGVESAFGAWTTVAAWRMNEPAEPPEQTIMHDTSGHERWGLIGSAVETGVVVDGATGYRWPPENVGGVHRERLVTVNRRAFNPRRDAFAVIVRLFTGAGDQNILQKGQAGTAGGMWKIDMLNGHVICTFKGSAGRAAIRSRQTVWDHVWHSVRCERRSTGVTIIVDGGVPRTQAGRTGWIANTKPLSIGGKLRCDPPDVQCDYYVGLLDRVVVRRH